jgi:hypothetical protein
MSGVVFHVTRTWLPLIVDEAFGERVTVASSARHARVGVAAAGRGGQEAAHRRAAARAPRGRPPGRGGQKANGITVKALIDVVEWLGDEQVAYVTYEAPPQIREQLNELERELDSESTRTQLVVKLPAMSDVREGEEFALWFDPHSMHLFDPASGNNITLKQAAPA